jgi:hypothetical protein
MNHLIVGAYAPFGIRLGGTFFRLGTCSLLYVCYWRKRLTAGLAEHINSQCQHLGGLNLAH